MMHFQVIDLVSVTVIGIAAVLWLVKIQLKLSKNKCTTVCSTCSGGNCATKDFTATAQKVNFYPSRHKNSSFMVKR